MSLALNLHDLSAYPLELDPHSNLATTTPLAVVMQTRASLEKDEQRLQRRLQVAEAQRREAALAARAKAALREAKLQAARQAQTMQEAARVRELSLQIEKAEARSDAASPPHAKSLAACNSALSPGPVALPRRNCSRMFQL